MINITRSAKLKRRAKLFASLALAGCVLGGCGVRGSLETPREAQATPKRTAAADSGQGKPEGAAPKPHKGFILDGLIR